MITERRVHSPQVAENEWVEFPGGELEGQRPRALCQACRATLQALSNAGRAPSNLGRDPASRRRSAPLCFECYRAELERQRALKAAGDLDTASDARFQFGLPFEPVNHARLQALRADRATARAAMQSGLDRFVDKRRHAQIAARHALQRIVAGLSERDAAHRAERESLRSSARHSEAVPASGGGAPRELEIVLADVTHAAELQLPEAWLPFVVAR